MKDLKAQHEELKKKNPKLLEALKKTAKGEIMKPHASTITTSTKGGDKKMNGRANAEKLLLKVCKDLKLSTPTRVNAKDDSKSGVGPLQALGKKGGIKVSVRSNDVVAYCPQKYLGFGRQAPGRWVHVTILSYGDANLEKAFRKALTDNKSGADWAKELNFIPRAQGAVDPKEKIKKLEAELKLLKIQETKLRKATKKTNGIKGASPATA